MASVLSAGQEVSLSQRNSGPLNHLEEDVFLFYITHYYLITILLSVQKVAFFHSVSNSILIRPAIFTDNTAATNSRHGIVTYFFGVTLDFALRDSSEFFQIH